MGTLGKGFEVEGVIEDTKVQSFAKNAQDVTGTAMSMYTLFNPDNRECKSTKVISVDRKKYTDGVYSAAKTFMEHHTMAFLNGL